MNLIKILLILASIFALPVTAQADQQTVKLNVEGMTCQSCPYQVKNALKRVEGVVSASASLKTREAVVIFDDAVTDIATLIQATTDAGFPSTLEP
jgi:mercuric ion binding protein